MSSNSRASAGLNSASLADGARWREGCNEYVQAKAHTTLAIGDVVSITASATGPLTAATPAIGGQDVGIVCETAAQNDWIKVQTRGFAEAGVEGTTDVAAGDFLEVLATESQFKKDGSAQTVNSVAVAVDAQAANSKVVVTVWLIGHAVTIASS